MTIPVPEFEWVEEIDTHVLTSDRAHGRVVRGRTAEANTRRFHLTWSLATATEYGQLATEWDTAKGSAGTTTYTPTPRGEGTPVTVRLIDFQARQRGTHWSMSCVLEEQYTPY